MKNKKSLNEEWEHPIPFDTIQRPEFPIDCLPLTLRNNVQAVSEATQTPIDMAGVAILAVIAACVQGKFEVEAKSDWREPLNLYCVIVANPAERKSAVLSLLTQPIYQYENEWNENHKSEIKRNETEKRSLEKAVEKLTDLFVKSGDFKDMAKLMQKRDELTSFEELRFLRLLADDTTQEALISLIANNGGKVSLISSEGGLFEIMQGRYAQSLNIEVFLKAHSGDVIQIDRKGREHESIENPCLTILLMVQPQVLYGLMSNNVFRGRGLTARFLYSVPSSKMGSRRHETQPISKKSIQAYKQLCYDLLGLPSKNSPDILRLSTGATVLSGEFAKKLEPRLIGDLEGIADFAGKLHGAILRIAGILHLANGNKSDQRISFDTMRSAIRLGRYFLRHAKIAFQLMGADKQIQDAKAILRQLTKRECLEMTRYEVFRFCRPRFRKDEDMTPAIELLEEYGYIREADTNYKGVGRKPSPKYYINPFIYGLNDLNG